MTAGKYYFVPPDRPSGDPDYSPCPKGLYVAFEVTSQKQKAHARAFNAAGFSIQGAAWLIEETVIQVILPNSSYVDHFGLGRIFHMPEPSKGPPDAVVKLDLENNESKNVYVWRDQGVIYVEKQ